MKINGELTKNNKDSHVDLNNKVHVKQRSSGWAVIVDNKIYTWGVTQDKANSIALRVMHKDML
jgi:hypothetical protein